MYLPRYSVAALSLMTATALSISTAQTPVVSDIFADTCDCSYFNGSNAFVCGNPMFGPTVLPNKFPMMSILSDYDRFAGLTPWQFYRTYWDYNAGRWKYPGTRQSRGFQLDVDGKPIRSMMVLPVNLRVDRFGDESGHYFAAADAPFTQRSLPPDALNMCKYGKGKVENCTADAKDWPYAYHAYEVARSFSVMGGPVAPGFGQPGLGLQFDLGEIANITDLVDMGYLRRLSLDDIELGPGTKAKCGKPYSCSCTLSGDMPKPTTAQKSHVEM